MKVVAVAALLAIACGGCGWIAQSKLKKHERRVEVYERLEPDREGLGRGDTRTTEDMLRKMAEWSGYIEQQALPPVERQGLVDRLGAAQRKYLLGSARLADTPDLAYALARSALTTDDPAALAQVREHADARAARRQELIGSTGSYFVDTGDDLMMAKVGGRATFVDGQVVHASSQSRLVERPGNCVFATRGFGAEGARNAGLAFRFVGDDAVIHVRCYLRRDPLGLPAEEGEWVIETSDPAGGYGVKGVKAKRGDQRFRDYVLTRRQQGKARFANVDVTLRYEYTADLVVVWERGVQRLRKLRKHVVLATSPLFWDGDGAAP